MKKLYIILLLLLCAVLVYGIRQNSLKEIISKADFSAPSGKLYYRIYLFGFLPVGNAVLEDNGISVWNKKKVYHLSAKAQAAGIISKLYPFTASIDSYLDENFLPVFFKQSLKTKDKDIVKEIRFYQDKNIMEILGVTRVILAQTYEPLSAIMRLRRMDFDKESNFDLNINTNQKDYALKGTARTQGVRLGKGVIKAYVLDGRIFRRDKNHYHQTNFTAVLSGAKFNTPVLMKFFSSGILVTITLVNAPK